MNKLEKQQIVEELSLAFQQSAGVFLFNFTGVNVEDATELRRKIRETKSGYRVVKNRLALRAAENTPLAGLQDQFQGPTAVVYTAEDSMALAKVLTEFLKRHPNTGFKGGILGQTVLSTAQVEELAEMPSREELLSKVLFLLNSPLTRLAGGLQTPLRNLASVLKQLAERDQKSGATD